MMPKHLAEKQKLNASLMCCFKHLWTQTVGLRTFNVLFKFVEGESILYFLIQYFGCWIYTKFLDIAWYVYICVFKFTGGLNFLSCNHYTKNVVQVCGVSPDAYNVDFIELEDSLFINYMQSQVRLFYFHSYLNEVIRTIFPLLFLKQLYIVSLYSRNI